MVAGVLLISVGLGAQTGSNPKSPVVRKTLDTAGEIDWGKPCAGQCAAGRQPRYYTFVDPEAVYKSIGDVLQELGFGLNPKGLKPKDNAFDTESKDAAGRLFWTDLIPLDDAMLRRFATTRAALRLTDDGKTFYAVQIAFSCDARNPLADMARENPNVAREEAVMSESGIPGSTARPAATQVNFAFSLLLKKRGEKSTYLDDSSEYDNGPILDWLYEKIAARIHQLKPDSKIDANSGGALG